MWIDLLLERLYLAYIRAWLVLVAEKLIMAFWRRNFGASGGVWRRLVAIERRIEWLRVFQIGYYGSFLSRDDRLGSVE